MTTMNQQRSFFVRNWLSYCLKCSAYVPAVETCTICCSLCSNTVDPQYTLGMERQLQHLHYKWNKNSHLAEWSHACVIYISIVWALVYGGFSLPSSSNIFITLRQLTSKSSLFCTLQSALLLFCVYCFVNLHWLGLPSNHLFATVIFFYILLRILFPHNYIHMLMDWLEVLLNESVCEVHFCVKSSRCIMILRHALMKPSMFMRAHEWGWTRLVTSIT